jgi:homopolymeric O-antigen transport system ATP-binding protein
MPAIEVQELGKRYRLGAHLARSATLREAIVRGAKLPFQRLSAVLHGESALLTRQSFWALRHLSLTIETGDAVGIIGRNGAGKTTLLKILSRITEPTEGRALIRGRVRSLLEVGTGFHPELTGRENIYLNGAILGMRRREIVEKFDRIVAFAEIDQFVDTAVKFYSSGMYVRLAFAVAAHLDPEVLLVDEVLAVGDTAFQRKCLGKMGEVAGAGRTVLFVSHNMETIQRLCNRCIWLEAGQVADDGPPGRVVASYLSRWRENLAHDYRAASEGERSEERTQLVEAQILDSTGEPSGDIHFGEPFTIRMVWKNRVDIPGGFYYLRAFDGQGRQLFALNHVGTSLEIERQGVHEIRCHFSHNVLAPGDYTLNLGCFLMPRTTLHAVDDCLGFSVLRVPHGDAVLSVPEDSIFAPRPDWTQVHHAG